MQERGQPDDRRRPLVEVPYAIGSERVRPLGLCDPLVDADSGLLASLGLLGRLAQTFFTSRLPKSPCGRRSMKTTRMEKTTRSRNELLSRPPVKSWM